MYYFIFMYFIAVIIQIILMGVAPVITGVDLLLPNTENELHPINELFILSWTQIVVYIGLTIGLICLTKKYLVKHFVNFLQNRKSLSLEFLIGFGIFWGATILSNLLLELLNIEGDSTNQEIIISILNGDYKWIVTFILVILGPLCEEIIFRHYNINTIISSLLSNCSLITIKSKDFSYFFCAVGKRQVAFEPIIRYIHKI